MANSGGHKRKPDNDDIEPIGTHKRQSNMETPDIALEEQEGTAVSKSDRSVRGPVRLLSLDGGGVRGLSSIMILKKIMERVNKNRASGPELEPWQIFDMIGGTSTGGIIAIMLGRLRMSLEDCLKEYLELSKQIFTPARSRRNFFAHAKDFVYVNGKFDEKILEHVIKKCVGKYSPVGEEDVLKKLDESCRVFVVATRVSNSEPALLRSYKNLDSSQAVEECKIWEACRATSAAKGFFESITIGKHNQTFTDGGLLYNNPIQLVHREAETIWPERNALLISIGTGSAPGGPFAGNFKEVVDAMKNILTETERTADDFYQSHRAMVNDNLLFRFNVTHGLAQIGLEEYQEVGSMTDATETYLDNGETGQKMRACVESLLETRSEVTHPLQLVRSLANCAREGELQNISSWLSPINFMMKQSDLIEKRQEGTGQWFLDTIEYTKWVNSFRTYIWCTGIPGAGKSVLASIVVDDLRAKAKNDTNIGVACLYLDEQAREAQSTANLLAALWRQLSAENFYFEEAEDLYKRHTKAATRPTLKEVSKLLRAELCRYTKTFVIVDALDECPEDNGIRDILLEELGLLPGSVNILFTSRNPPTLDRYFPDPVRIEIRAAKQDVTKYLQGQMSRLQDFIRTNPDLQQAIVRGIIDVIDGMFLLAPFHIESLRDKCTLREVKNTLASLSKGPHAIHNIYDATMRRIECQMKGHQDMAKLVLSWLIHARRPLTVTELRHALAVYPGDIYLNPDGIPPEEALTQYCKGLVTVAKPSNIIQLVHTTAREYFKNTRNDMFPNAETRIAITCLTYISFDVFTRDPCIDSNVMEIRLQQHPLLDYAARHWSEHVCSSPENEVKDLVLRFLEKEPNRRCCSLLDSGIFRYIRRSPRHETALHVAAGLGLRLVVESLLRKGVRFYAKDQMGMTAIQKAAEGRHKEVVQLLSESKDFRVNSKIDEHKGLLSWAAQLGYDETVELMTLKSNIEIDSEDEEGQTALSHAAENGHEEIVRLLLAKGAKAGSQDANGQTALSYAAENGHEEIVRLLLAKGAKAGSQDANGQTALSYAAENGHEEIVRLLLARGAKAGSQDANGKTALHKAADSGHLEVMRLLLDEGAEIEARDLEGKTPLFSGALNEQEQVVSFLVGKGADIEAKDKNGMNPLRATIHYSLVEGARSLLQNGAILQADKDDGCTALHNLVYNFNDEHMRYLKEQEPHFNVTVDYRLMLGPSLCSGGHEEMVQLLLKGGLDLEAKDNQGRTALHYAASNAHEVLTKVLLRRGANIEGPDKHGNTALQIAVSKGNESMVRMLLARRANVNAKNVADQRPIHVAVVTGNKAMVELLLGEGALLEVGDELGLTPLQLASSLEEREIEELLLAKSTDITARSR